MILFRCSFRILKMDQTLYPVKWSAPHRTYQGMVERVHAHQEHVCAYQECVRARQECVCIHGQVVKAVGKPRPWQGVHARLPCVHVQRYQSTPMDTCPHLQVRARACIEPI